MSLYSQGQSSHQVAFSMFKENRSRLVARFQDAPKSSIILLKGGDEKPIEDTDIDQPFKQESWFMWAFGVAEPGFQGMIDMTGRATLFMPRMDPQWQAFLGKIKSPDEFLQRYEVDEVRYVDEMPEVVNGLNPETLYLLSGVNTDSGLEAPAATFAGINKHHLDKGRLRHEMQELRLVKTRAEIEVMRYACKVTADAHKATMRACRPGLYEYQLEATFMYHMYFDGGCRYNGYGNICGSGPNSSIMHYGHAGLPNGRQMQDGDMVLCDMGAEYGGYDGDLTLSYPVNGRFTQDQRDIYETVYAMLRTVQASMKPGVSWPDMHRLSYRVMCEELKRRGFLQGDVDEMLRAHIPALFMPHGLGHLLGLDTHDVGGYPRGITRPQEPGICRLRCGRALVEGMVLTVEPGVYFNAFLLEPALANPETARLFNVEKVRRFMNFGGVRLEDNVVVTATGVELLDDVPRSVEEVERWMAGQDYKQ